MKYEKTNDPKRMMTHAELDDAIKNDYENIKDFLPCRTATYLEYKAGGTEALVWNEGENTRTRITLPLDNGWYLPDGNPFAIPNGRESTIDDPDALYLVRHQDREFRGPLGRGDGCGGWGVYSGGRDVDACYFWSSDSGVALVKMKNTEKYKPSERIKEIATELYYKSQGEQAKSGFYAPPCCPIEYLIKQFYSEAIIIYLDDVGAKI